ncbi:thiamine-monophosphate kinase [Halopseudomonas pertucinogena]|uniref:Thiamine-monophosphate kinase n=1 Tax=Halopseudomonas pertucinogena TaxID=86175 RepID=A0ABQ2CUD5_9GAMM|nr:thiamine-phosphate kinase [Halopseudomonas pertucinogena]GGJ09451.1 thiamine-monophosphate kinase [Halopseudomonas pertucinogena]
MSLGEFGLIGRYFQRTALQHAGGNAAVALGIGDDAALLEPTPGCQWVISTDSLVQGVHFPGVYSPFDLGYRALAVAVSDLAAMAARPLGFTLALTLPDVDESWLQGFSDGLARCAGDHHISLIGGDTTRGPLNIGVTVYGEVPAGQALRRSGARPGDLLCVGGPLGDGAAGLAVVLRQSLPEQLDAGGRDYLARRFWQPRAQCELGLALRGRATAAMDISDGLLQDAGHMARASGVALHLQRSLLPHCAALAAWPECQRLDWMLRGGDDYVLLFSIAAADLEQLGDWPVTVIGRVEAGEGVWLDGQPAAADGGYQHFKEPSDG